MTMEAVQVRGPFIINQAEKVKGIKVLKRWRNRRTEINSMRFVHDAKTPLDALNVASQTPLTFSRHLLISPSVYVLAGISSTDHLKSNYRKTPYVDNTK